MQLRMIGLAQWVQHAVRLMKAGPNASFTTAIRNRCWKWSSNGLGLDQPDRDSRTCQSPVPCG